MRFDEEMDRRLRNWARWVVERQDGGRVATCSFEERVDGEGHDAPTVIPTNDAEAVETHRGLQAISPVQSRAIVVWYSLGGTVARRCHEAGCSETTLRERVCAGQRALAQWLADQRAAADAERRRVEALQRKGVLGVVGLC